MKTIIIRHRRENLRKCSLFGLEHRPDLEFHTYPMSTWPDVRGFVLLKVGAPVLSTQDKGKNLLLLDGTWKLASVMEKQLPPGLEARSLPPGFVTAYPRRQTECPDPTTGLASVEALYLAYVAFGENPSGLLECYHWKNQFLEINQL